MWLLRIDCCGIGGIYLGKEEGEVDNWSGRIRLGEDCILEADVRVWVA
jgi:hypothetical protein